MEYQYQDFNKCEVLLSLLRHSAAFGFLAERYKCGEREMVKRDSFQVYYSLSLKLFALRQVEESGGRVCVC